MWGKPRRDGNRTGSCATAEIEAGLVEFIDGRVSSAPYGATQLANRVRPVTSRKTGEATAGPAEGGHDPEVRSRSSRPRHRAPNAAAVGDEEIAKELERSAAVVRPAAGWPRQRHSSSARDADARRAVVRKRLLAAARAARRAAKRAPTPGARRCARDCWSQLADAPADGSCTLQRPKNLRGPDRLSSNDVLSEPRAALNDQPKA